MKVLFSVICVLIPAIIAIIICAIICKARQTRTQKTLRTRCDSIVSDHFDSTREHRINFDDRYVVETTNERRQIPFRSRPPVRQTPPPAYTEPMPLFSPIQTLPLSNRSHFPSLHPSSSSKYLTKPPSYEEIFFPRQ